MTSGERDIKTVALKRVVGVNAVDAERRSRHGNERGKEIEIRKC